MLVPIGWVRTPLHQSQGPPPPLDAVSSKRSSVGMHDVTLRLLSEGLGGFRRLGPGARAAAAASRENKRVPLCACVTGAMAAAGCESIGRDTHSECESKWGRGLSPGGGGGGLTLTPPPPPDHRLAEEILRSLTAASLAHFTPIDLQSHQPDSWTPVFWSIPPEAVSQAGKECKL